MSNALVWRVLQARYLPGKGPAVSSLPAALVHLRRDRRDLAAIDLEQLVKHSIQGPCEETLNGFRDGIDPHIFWYVWSMGFEVALSNLLQEHLVIPWLVQIHVWRA